MSRRERPALTAPLVEAFLVALPEWSPSAEPGSDVAPVAVRARYLLQYETGLRATTLQRLEVRHYDSNSSEIRLTADLERHRPTRTVPLTPRAREAVERVLVALGAGHTGPIFGFHDFKRQVRRAACAAFPADVVESFREIDVQPLDEGPCVIHSDAGWSLEKGAGGTWNVSFRSGARACTRSTGTKDRAQALVRAAEIYAEVMKDAPERPCDRLEREAEEHRTNRIAAIKFDRLAKALDQLKAHAADEARKAERRYAERYRTQPLPPEEWLLDSKFPTLERAAEIWLGEFRTTHAAVTLDVWRLYARNLWPGHFTALERVTHVALKEYMRARLAVVTRESVRKELFALSSFLQFCSESFDLPRVEVPRLPKRALGRPWAKRRRKGAPELSPQQVRAVLRELPEWSSACQLDAEQYPVRARFHVQYETGLRSSTVDRLRVPEHYSPGQSFLRLTPDIDKARFGREVPLTKRARRILDYLIRKLGPNFEGPLFSAADGSKHDYRKRIGRAAHKVLPRDVAKSFCAAHLRSARITHLLEAGANIVGVKHLVGHKQISTTDKYVRSGFRAATNAINVWEGRA